MKNMFLKLSAQMAAAVGKIWLSVKTYKAELIVSVSCLAAMSAILWRYAVKDPITTWYEWAVVILDVLLFSSVGVVFIFRCFSSWRKPEVTAASSQAGIWKYVRIFLMMLAVHVIRILFAYALKALDTETLIEFRDALDVWKAPDTEHYMNIASHWYRGLEEDGVVWRLVFLPFYPILIKGVSFITGEYFIAGMIVSVLSSSAAGCVLYALARLDMSEAASLRAVRYYAILPAAFFYTTAMTESLFMLLSLLCIYGARKRNWLLSGIAGGLAAFTRSVGLVLLAPVLFEWLTAVIKERETEWRINPYWGFAILLIPAGFGAYLLINYAETGDAFRFAAYQKEHWFQGPDWFFDSARYHISNLVSYYDGDMFVHALALWLSSLISRFAALALMLACVRRQRPSYTLYSLAYYTVTMGVTWLLSAPRYLLVLFPIVFTLAWITKKRQTDAAVTIACLLLGTLYLFAYSKQMWVY